MALQPGQQVGRYRVVRMLAQGGMAEVYRAEQELAAGIFRPAALKVIRPEYSESPDFREMFLDEARTASTLSHPNIAHIYDVGEEQGLVYMAMELVPGETLAVVCRTLRESGDRLSNEALFSVGIHTCSALEAVHALRLPGEGHLNLVHRDVSPHNLLLSATGSLKLIDFGIAKAATNRNLTMPGVTKGKAGYFSPEQAMGKPLDGRSDLFSLGITLYKLASGFTPFDEHKTHQTRNQALVYGRWEPLEKACPGLPRSLYEIVAKSLMVKPDDRYLHARQMREALEQAALAAGLHVGQSSLTGYVDDAGEIAAPPTAPKAAAFGRPPAVTEPEVESAPTSPKPVGAAAQFGGRKTERVAPPKVVGNARRTRQWLIGVSVFAGAAIAGVGALFAFDPPGQTPVSVPLPLPVPVPEVVRPPPVARVDPPSERPSPVVEATVDPDPGEALDKPLPDPRLPVRKPKPGKGVATDVKPPADERIPRGIGKLRVGAVPDGTVSVGSETWGQAPVDRKISSGQHRVSVVAANGKRGTCLATVTPDKTTIVIYNFVTGTCR